MMTTRLEPRKKTPSADFSLAIINVVFLLLFFFILTGTVVQRVEMEVRAPNTENLPLERLPRPLIVVSDHGTLHLDGKEISGSALLDKINKSGANNDGEFKQLNVLADGRLSAKIFLASIDFLHRSGLPVRIVTVRAGKARQFQP
jgi:biopolymer transport protein ExbD